jgi:hypothetical protein
MQKASAASVLAKKKIDAAPAAPGSSRTLK